MAMTLRMYTIQAMEELRDIVQKGWETLSIGQRIKEARERLPDEKYIPGLINILRAEGLTQDARDVSLLYNSALAVADYQR